MAEVIRRHPALVPAMGLGSQNGISMGVIVQVLGPHKACTPSTHKALDPADPCIGPDGTYDGSAPCNWRQPSPTTIDAYAGPIKKPGGAWHSDFGMKGRRGRASYIPEKSTGAYASNGCGKWHSTKSPYLQEDSSHPQDPRLRDVKVW